MNKHIVSVTRVYSKCDLSRIILLTMLLQLNYFDSTSLYPVAHLQNNLLLVNQFEVTTARGSGAPALLVAAGCSGAQHSGTQLVDLVALQN